MKVLICYFSGTGNTRKVVEKYKSTFEESGNSVKILPIEQALTDDGVTPDFVQELATADVLGIGYPIHAFNAPSIVLDFAKRLPKSATTKRVFVVKTSGEPLKLNNVSSLKLAKLLKRRNYVVTNEYHYCMPYNIMFRHSDGMAYRMWDTAQKIVPLDVKEIEDGTQKALPKIFAGDFVAWVMRCEHWGGRLNGRQYKVNANCAHCLKCVNVCPTHNITLKDGKFKFGKKCLMCMRCAHLCPKNAVKIGWFNHWKVNGAYTFEQAEQDERQQYNKMLTKAYQKYFEDCDKRLAAADVATNT